MYVDGAVVLAAAAIAPRATRFLAALFGVVLLCISFVAPSSAESPQPLPELWAVEVGSGFPTVLKPADLERASGQRINAVVIDRRKVSTRSFARIRQSARARGWKVIAPVLPQRAKQAPVCSTGNIYAVWAKSMADALALPGRRCLDVVVVPVESSAALARVPANRSGPRIVALVRVTSMPLSTSTWENVISRTELNAGLSLGVGMSGKRSRPSLDTYLRVLARVARDEEAGEERPDATASDPTAGGAGEPGSPTPPYVPPSWTGPEQPSLALNPGAYVSQFGSDLGTCSFAAPCVSFDRAYRVVGAGGVVEVAGGVYPGQVVRFDPSKSAGVVVFRPAVGASVRLAGDLLVGDDKSGVGASNLEFRDMAVGQVQLRRGADNVTLRNLDGSRFLINSAHRVRVLGGDWGPMGGGHSTVQKCGDPGCLNPTQILIDGAYFHDTGVTDSEQHQECLAIWGGIGVTVRNSRFERCTYFDIFVKRNSRGSEIGFLVFENNVFDVPISEQVLPFAVPNSGARGGPAVRINPSGGGIGHVLFRYNSSLAPITVDSDKGPLVNVRFIGNVFPKPSNWFCGAGISYAYNVFDGAKCSPTDKKAPLGFINPATVDLRLAAGSAGIGGGDPVNHPERDVAGHDRPAIGAPDAGAHEQ